MSVGPREKERKKTDNPKEGWEDGTPPPHRDFKERSVVLAVCGPESDLPCPPCFCFIRRLDLAQKMRSPLPNRNPVHVLVYCAV